MAIVLEFNVILARKVEIEQKYPGGLACFRESWLLVPPERFCEDDHLIAFSSMGWYFNDVFKRLTHLGIDVFHTDESVESDATRGSCAWIEWSRQGPMVRGWLKGSEPGSDARFSRGLQGPADEVLDGGRTTVLHHDARVPEEDVRAFHASATRAKLEALALAVPFVLWAVLLRVVAPEYSLSLLLLAGVLVLWVAVSVLRWMHLRKKDPFDYWREECGTEADRPNDPSVVERITSAGNGR